MVWTSHYCTFERILEFVKRDYPELSYDYDLSEHAGSSYPGEYCKTFCVSIRLVDDTVQTPESSNLYSK